CSAPRSVRSSARHPSTVSLFVARGGPAMPTRCRLARLVTVVAVRVGVVGAGVVGLATTYELARAGHEVWCFEADEPMAARSTGETRIFRLAHATPALVEWAVRAGAGRRGAGGWDGRGGWWAGTWGTWWRGGGPGGPRMGWWTGHRRHCRPPTRPARSCSTTRAAQSRPPPPAASCSVRSETCSGGS